MIWLKMDQICYSEKIKNHTQSQKNKTQVGKSMKTKQTTMKSLKMTNEIQMKRQKEMIYLKILNMIILLGLKWTNTKSLALMIRASLKNSVIMLGCKLILRLLRRERRMPNLIRKGLVLLMIIQLMMKKFSISLGSRGNNKCKKIISRILMMSLVMTFKDLLILIMLRNQWLSG